MKWKYLFTFLLYSPFVVSSSLFEKALLDEYRALIGDVKLSVCTFDWYWFRFRCSCEPMRLDVLDRSRRRKFSQKYGSTVGSFATHLCRMFRQLKSVNDVGASPIYKDFNTVYGQLKLQKLVSNCLERVQISIGKVRRKKSKQ